MSDFPRRSLTLKTIKVSFAPLSLRQVFESDREDSELYGNEVSERYGKEHCKE